MANGNDAEKFVLLSKVRSGHKREFAFAWKSQNEIAGSLGRTRSRKSLGGSNEDLVDTTANKRLKKSSPESRTNCDGNMVDVMGCRAVETVETKDNAEELKAGEDKKDENQHKLVIESEDEPKSDVVDVLSDDDNKCQDAESLRNGEEKKNGAEMTGLSGDEHLKSVPLVESEKKASAVTSDGGTGIGKTDEGNVEKTPANEEMERDNVNSRDKQEMPPPSMLERHTKRVTRSAMKMDEGINGTQTEPVRENGDSRAASCSSPFVAHPANSEVNIPKNVQLKTLPTRLKDLLDTGLLEGLRVRYVRGFKSKAPQNMGLCGVVRGSGILCFCEQCSGEVVVSPNQFELHAGSSNKRPPDYIYLENGNTFRDVLNACKDSNLVSLEETIRKVIGCSSEKKSYCINCKGPISESGIGRTMLLCDLCMELRDSRESRTPKKSTSLRLPEPLSNTKSSDSMMKHKKRLSSIPSSDSSINKSQGRITRKDLRLHKLVFEEDILPDGTEVAYYSRGKKLLSGHKIGFGIFCNCCQKEVSPSQFEAHAGCASRRKPYLNIYTSNGVSLHELSISLTKSRKLTTDESDDLCSICSDGGDLLCCDGCPRAFHKECIPLSTVPADTWYCRYCESMFQKEKFVERNANAIAAGRIPGVDPIEQITQRCIRIVTDLKRHEGGCVFCRSPGFSKEFGPRTVLLCDQCEKEYHVGCLRDNGIQDLKTLPEGDWFCSSDCNKIHSTLRQLTEQGDQELPDTLLDMITRKLVEKGLDGNKPVIRWRLLSGKMQSVDEIRVLLSKAVSIFHEQFDPIYYESAKQDLIPHMVYGRKIRERELRGMHCAVLTVDSKVVSAGVVRVFSKDVAELPLVATSSDCQGLGYFQALYSCMETLLGHLDVQNLLLPAAEEAKQLWTNKFGFTDIQENELNGLRKCYDVMIFDGTSMLRKEVPKDGSS